MSKQPPPAPTASAVGPCPTLFQTSRTPRHRKFTQNHRTTRPPPRRESVLKNKSTKPRKLPPTDDSFSLHLLRCHYQLIVWKGRLSPIQHLPEPQDFGYIFNTGTGLLTPQLMSQPVAPPELLSDLVCECVDLCEQGCICSLNEQSCTQACDCKAKCKWQRCMHEYIYNTSYY